MGKLLDPTQTYSRGDKLKASKTSVLYKASSTIDDLEYLWCEISLVNVKEERIKKLQEYTDVFSPTNNSHITQMFCVWIELTSSDPNFAIFLSPSQMKHFVIIFEMSDQSQNERSFSIGVNKY